MRKPRISAEVRNEKSGKTRKGVSFMLRAQRDLHNMHLHALGPGLFSKGEVRRFFRRPSSAVEPSRD